MTRTTFQFCWDFPGGGPGLAAALVASLALILLSYRFTLRELRPWPRFGLILLRTVAVLALFFCVCQPRRVSQTTAKTDPPKKKIVVVVDESSSMRLKSVLGRPRLADALATWGELQSRCGDRYDVKFYAFAETLREISGPEALKNPPEKTLHTRFYRNVADWSGRFAADGVDAVVCLTDGVDTDIAGSGGPGGTVSLASAVDALTQSALPHLFIPMRAAVAAPPGVEFRKLEAKNLVRPGSRVPVTALVEIAGIQGGGPLKFQALENGRVLYEKTLPASLRSRTVALNFDVDIVAAGPHRFEGVVSWGATRMAAATWSIQAVADDTGRILLYQGALGWGTRFLRYTFEHEGKTTLDVRYSPDLFPGQSGSGHTTGFPSADKLQEYTVLILMNLTRAQITPGMEDSLRQFLKSGGGILFVIANPDAAREFAASPLEKLLPVTFEPDTDNVAKFDAPTREFLRKMKEYRNSVRRYGGSNEQLDVPPLVRFKPTAEGLAGPLFRKDGGAGALFLPSFQEAALVQGPKPGAAVLAVHPVLADARGNPRVLLAAQNFGQGRSAVLATDPLWRWRLSLESGNPGFDLFWRNLVAWLGAGRGQRPEWILPSAVWPAGKPAELRFILPKECNIPFRELTFHAEEQGGKVFPLTLIPSGTAEYRGIFVPERTGGEFRIQARHQGETVAEAFLSTPGSCLDLELKELTPRPAVLQNLAAACGGKVLLPENRAEWAAWLPAADVVAPVVERQDVDHLWHRTALFLVILACIVAELLLRRFWKLL